MRITAGVTARVTAPAGDAGHPTRRLVGAARSGYSDEKERSMAFSAAPPAAPAWSMNPTLQANSRLYPIGVRRYEAFPKRPVPSATRDALSWLLQGLRMGISPTQNALAVEEAGDEALMGQLHAVLASADLSPAEREGVGALLGQKDWHVTPPTFADVLSDLVLLGNHLSWNPLCRLLVTFTGHGLLQGDLLTLCLKDTRPREKASTALTAQAKALVAAVEDRALSDESCQIDGTTPRAVKAGFRAAVSEMVKLGAKKGVLAEVLDVLQIPAAMLGLRYRPAVMLTLTQRLLANLRGSVGDLRGRATPTHDGVLTVAHLLLALGDVADRCTLVLDACHAGGPGEALQGAAAGHGWTEAGLRARLISTSAAGERAAEARLGERRTTAATWALTAVLSRWAPVKDGPAYALGIRNGELVHRANLLLAALSFRQRISLHAPAPADGDWAVADLPFCGLSAATPTRCEPTEDAGGIQLDSDYQGITSKITFWLVGTNGALKAVFLALGSTAPAWSFTAAGRTTVYAPGRLYLFSKSDDVAALAGVAGLSLTMKAWDPAQSPQAPGELASAVGLYGNQPLAEAPASEDPEERRWIDGAPQNNVVAFQRPFGGRRVYLRWEAPRVTNGVRQNGGCLQMVTKAVFPFHPTDFVEGSAMAFAPEANPGFTAANAWQRTFLFPVR
jgi:hypothetical protein